MSRRVPRCSRWTAISTLHVAGPAVRRSTRLFWRDPAASGKIFFLLVALVVLLGASSLFAQQWIPLNNNFNGMLSAEEWVGFPGSWDDPGVADTPNGYRSISDRGLRNDGEPGTFGSYPMVGATGLSYTVSTYRSFVLDMVLLGNRNTVDGSSRVFDPAPDLDNIGIQPTWLANPDLTGPQTTTLATPLTIGANWTLGVVYNISNGGGSFVMVVHFVGGGSASFTLQGPDWYGAQDGWYNNPPALGAGVISRSRLGTFQAVEWTDNPWGYTEVLNVCESVVTLNPYTGSQLASVSFQSRGNTNASYGIYGLTLNNPNAPTGSGASEPYPVVIGATALLTVVAVPGSGSPNNITSVVVDGSRIGLPANQALYDDGTHGDAIAGDNTWSLSSSFTIAMTPGTYNLPFTLTDAQSRIANGAIMLALSAPQADFTPPSVPAGGATKAQVRMSNDGSPTPDIASVVLDGSVIGLGNSLPLNDLGGGGDLTAGDGTYSRDITVPGATPAGGYELPFTVTDQHSNVYSGLMGLTVGSVDPISATGWNRDVVVENTAMMPFENQAAERFEDIWIFFEQNASLMCGPVDAQGLPSSRRFNSTANPPYVVHVELQSYGNGDNVLSPNVLYMSASTVATGTLTFVPDAQKPYDILAIIATSGAGGGNGTLTINFADGTSSDPLSFSAPDWFYNDPFALDDLGRASITDGWLDNRQGQPRLYQTILNLTSLGLNAKAIQSLTFTKPAESGVTGIFAVSGALGTAPTGACCIAASGICALSTAAGCQSPDVWYGDGSTCPQNCAQPTGACCLPDGTCVSNTPPECQTAGGTWQAGECGVTVLCPQPGACCFGSGDCQFLPQLACEAQGGTFYGEGVPCQPTNPCPQPGACCFPEGRCEMMQETPCWDAGGTPQVAGTTCTPTNPCSQPWGGCCYNDTTCADQSEADCLASGGTWHFPELCGAFTCLPAPNLLVNGGAEDGDMTGWTNLVGHWCVHGHAEFRHTGGYSFMTGAAMCTRNQEVDLIALGYTAEQLDTGLPQVVCSDWILSRSAAVYFVRFELLDASHQVLASWEHGTAAMPIALGVDVPYFEESHAFTGYPAGVRFINFMDGGGTQDPASDVPWGTHFDDAWVGLLFADGACCLGTGCSTLSGADCAAVGGTFLGSTSSCSPNPCAPFACCLPDGTCAMEMLGDCLAAGGVFNDGFTCGDIGPCPQPGACCFANGHCGYLPEPNCTAQGGEFQGVGVPCTSDLCPAPADFCADAHTVLTGVPATGSNANATTDGLASCGGGGARDVWYKWTAPCSAVATFSLCVGSDGFDSVLAVFAGACGSLTELGCDDDGCGVGGGPSTVTTNVTGGNAYYIRIAGWDGSTGAYTLTVTYGGCIVKGDLNCSGTVDINDIAPFVLALLDPAAYATQYPGCDINLADMDGNTLIDGADIQGFVDALLAP